MNTRIPVQPATTLAVFDGLSRGGQSPDWITQGIRSKWLPSSTHLDVTLIAVSENATFLVEVGGRRTMVVRLQRPGYVTEENVRSELEWIEALSGEGGVTTPAPIRGIDGQLVQVIAEAGGPRWTAVAFEHVDGSVLEDHDDPTAHFAEIGRVSGVLHEHSRRWVPPRGFTRFSWTLDDMVGPQARWGSWANAPVSRSEAALLSRAQEIAVSSLSLYATTPETWGLIHSDLRPSNIMVSSEALTVIDFDDAGYSWYLYDFASALTFYEHREIARTMAREWLLGYSEVAPLSAQDLRHALDLSMIRRLTMLGWSTTHRADALPPDLWAENLPGTLEVADRYVSNPYWLIE
jgi:Ser/Thr protein kinase RdoA (MazF antagonist)